MGNNDDYWVYNKEEFIDEFNIPKNVIDMVCQELNKSFDKVPFTYDIFRPFNDIQYDKLST